MAAAVFCTTPLFGEPARQKNLAAGISYQATPSPNYWGWKNPQHGDHGQLTDGVLNEAWETKGAPLYAQHESMGWDRKPPVVVFDLGARRKITGFGLHSCLSPWGPWWPTEITVLVSDNNKDFYLAGPPVRPSHETFDPPLADARVQEAIGRILVKKGRDPSLHWFRQHGLDATGRYLSLIHI